jgi:dTDP-4-amino-4,6-dideoxygalactose transaminase
MTRWPVYDDEQIEAVSDVLRSGKVNAWTGSHVSEFERTYAEYLGTTRTIALANGTLALDLALRVIDLQPGDEVIVTPRSFVASASCVPMAGGVPVFADVELDSQNMSARTITPCITPRTKAIIVVHLAGWPCDMLPIIELAKKHGIWVIEDCAQAHGAFYHGKPVGTWGDLAAFSFCQDKIITTGGEGGLFVARDEKLWSRAWSYKDHGKSHDAVFNREHPPGFRWLHESFGTNWRMTALQAVLGTQQLKKLSRWNEERKSRADEYMNVCMAIPALRVPVPPTEVQHAWYRFYAFVRPEKLRPDWNRDRILVELNGRGVTCFSGSCPEIYLEKSFVDAGFGPLQRLPGAAALGQTAIAFLVDPSEEDSTIAKNAAALSSVMEEASLR